MKKDNLTLKYTLTQFTFWAAVTGAESFATTYLLDYGVPSGIVGLLLAASGLLSCLTQPILAGIADKSKQFILPKMMLAMSILSTLCFSILLIPSVPIAVAGLCYMIGTWSSDAMIPFTNALCVSYTQNGYSVNYGVGRGIGAAASAISSLALGFVIAQFGSIWMILLLVIFRLLFMLILCSYPKITKNTVSHDTVDYSCTIPVFFSRYRWYCISLLGIAFLGMFLTITENYLIAIIGALGGDSSHVGIALFISSLVVSPTIFFFSKIRAKIQDTNLLKIAAVSFLIRAVCLYFAKDVTTVYLIQLLHITSYGFMHPTQVYYANASVHKNDMVKGQAFITAAYALGCSAGNFTGGQLLGLGVEAILIAGIAIALIGTIIIFATVSHSKAIQ